MKLHEIIMEGPLDFFFGSGRTTFKVPMPLGKRGNDVRDMQQALEALGYTVGPPGLDGIIGPYTETAIRNYQKDNGMEATGKPNGQMIQLLNKQLESKPDVLSKLKPSTSGDYKLPSSAKGARNRVNPADISNYLAKKGLDRNHILGMLANIEQESGFNSGAYNSNDVNGPSGGLFQHHDKITDPNPESKRFSKMVAACGNNWQSNWQGQLDFALSEPEGRRYLATSFSSPEAATDWWVRKFERPRNPDMEVARRQSNLSKYA